MSDLRERLAGMLAAAISSYANGVGELTARDYADRALDLIAEECAGLRARLRSWIAEYEDYVPGDPLDALRQIAGGDDG